jgi:hypothetical protein
MTMDHLDPRRDGGGAAVPTTPSSDDPTTSEPQLGGTSRRAGASYRSWITVLAGVILLPLAVISALTLPATAPTRAAEAATARVVDAAALEAEFGIRVTLVAVTADGGLVDLRFAVVDQAKASHLLHDSASMPALFVERSGRLLTASHPLAHKMTIVDGASYFLFYANSGGAIQDGTAVSVVIDDVRSAPIDAQT